MGYNTTFILYATQNNEDIDIKIWTELLNNLEFLNNDQWLKDWLLKIYNRDKDGRRHNHREYMQKISKMLPALTLILKGEGEEDGDIWSESWKDGVLIEDKDKYDKYKAVKWLRQKHPNTYYQYKLQLNKPKPQMERYKIKRFLKGISIVRGIFHKYAANKIQKVWDKYWYRPNAEGESRAALKNYDSFINNKSLNDNVRKVKNYRIRYEHTVTTILINGDYHTVKLPPTNMILDVYYCNNVIRVL